MSLPFNSVMYVHAAWALVTLATSPLGTRCSVLASTEAAGVQQGPLKIWYQRRGASGATCVSKNLSSFTGVAKPPRFGGLSLSTAPGKWRRSVVDCVLPALCESSERSLLS